MKRGLWITNSACAASGLNDFDTTDPGQNSSQVQTAADSWKFYGFPPGATGTLGALPGVGTVVKCSHPFT